MPEQRETGLPSRLRSLRSHDDRDTKIALIEKDSEVGVDALTSGCAIHTTDDRPRCYCQSPGATGLPDTEHTHVTHFERANHSPSTTAPSLTVAASPDQLEIVRAFVRTTAAHYPFSVDARTDLVLAVDEAAGMLLEHTQLSGTLTCTFDMDTEHLRVISTATPTAPIDTNATSFRWFVLQRLIDRIVLEQFPSTAAGAPGNSSATIILSKAVQAGS